MPLCRDGVATDAAIRQLRLQLASDRDCAHCPCREIVKRIDMWAIDMVFVVGGNGGNAGAAAIQAQCEKDGVVCNVVSCPKSIDNDILIVSKPPWLIHAGDGIGVPGSGNMAVATRWHSGRMITDSDELGVRSTLVGVFPSRMLRC